MIDPSLDQLLTHVDSRYTLVVVAAKRAREIMAQDGDRQEDKAMKSVTHALEEICTGKVQYEQTRFGIK